MGSGPEGLRRFVSCSERYSRDEVHVDAHKFTVPVDHLSALWPPHVLVHPRPAVQFNQARSTLTGAAAT